MDPDFSGSDPDFWPIQIRTLDKSSIRILKKKPGSKTLQPSICKPTNAMQCHPVIQIDFSYLSDNEFALHYLYTRHFLKRFP